MREFLRVEDAKTVYGLIDRNVPLNRNKCDMIARHDLKVYTENDVFSYYIACNTWVLYAEDLLGRQAGNAIIANITRFGLATTIDQAVALYDAYRADDTFWSHGVRKNQVMLLEGDNEGVISPTWLRDPNGPLVFDLWAWSPIFDRGSRDEILSVLVYLKRFSSPGFAAKLKKAALDGFLAVNKRCSEFESQNLKACADAALWDKVYPVSRTWTPPLKISQYLLDKLRDAYARIYRNVPDFTSWDYEDIIAYGHFSSGATREVERRNSCLAAKIPHLQKRDGYFGSSFSYLPCTADHRYWDTEWKMSRSGAIYPWAVLHRGTSDDCSEIVAVPKTHKSDRIIAEESTSNGFAQQAVEKLIELTITDEGLSKAYTKDDQSNNKFGAWLGANSNLYATIDMTSASDSVSREFIRITHPRRIYKAILRFASEYALVDGKKVRLHTLLTSGTGLTFGTESRVFYGICLVGTEIAELHLEQKLLPPIIYGDDCVVDKRAYDIICEILEECGFRVNSGKSFAWGTTYRESCGIECFEGYHYQPLYYPRSGLNIHEPAELVAQLVDMQKKFYFVSASTAYFLEQCVRCLAPWMTYSKAGTNCSDLWTSCDMVQECLYSPYAEIREEVVLGETVRWFHPLAKHKESYMDLHACLISDAITSKAPSGEAKAACDAYLYHKWLENPTEFEEVPFVDDVIYIYPAGVSRDKLLYPQIVGWSLLS
jgi:hypothetical protein